MYDTLHDSMTQLEEQHIADVREIQKQMKSFFLRKQKIKIYHGSTNSTRAQKFERDKLVDLSKFDRIINLNTADRYVLVEPNVPMDNLIDATLEHGFIPPVVMEFPGITVGGGVQGGAGESSSFKHGLFHDTCLEFEMILGNGEVINVSRTQNAELFYGTACSYGSLGIITLVKLQLVPAKDFVHLTYQSVTSSDDAIRLIKKKVREPEDFIDGIIFKKNRGVVMTGKLSGKKDLPIATFLKRTDEWFYIHADSISKNHQVYEELVPIKDYLFRYDRGAFWGGYYLFDYFKIPFIKIMRVIFDNLSKTRSIYRLAHSTNVTQQYFVQDLCVPQEGIQELLQFIATSLNIYPLWLCPLRPGIYDNLSPTRIRTDLVINVGVWGKIEMGYDNFIHANRSIENKVRSLGGRKVLYAHAYYPKGEFWQIYDHAWYTKLRKKYHASSVFPDIYDKTKVTEKYKSSVFFGVLKAFWHKKVPIS